MDRDGNGVLDESEFGGMLRRLKSSGRLVLGVRG